MVLGNKISAIKAGISSFTQLSLKPEVTSINVHCNSIRDFVGLTTPRLKELDASSNQITELSGLQKFGFLTNLNLACNQISSLEGVGGLTNLVFLNISYNKITSLEEFSKMNGMACKLQTLELHGNGLSDVANVITSLSGVLTLRHLVLSRDEKHDNPVCKECAYRERIFSGLSQLLSLDSKDCNNQVTVPSSDNVLKVLGLDLSLSELDYSTEVLSASTQPSSPEKFLKGSMRTPNIDAVLQNNRPRRPQAVPSQSENSVESTISSSEKDGDFVQLLPINSPKQSALNEVQINQEVRLKYLESQLANLVSARQETQKATNVRRNETKTKENSSSPHSPKSRVPKSSGSSRGKSQSKLPRKNSRERTDVQEKDTYLNLVKELEAERERRWKSEQAAKKLAEIVRHLTEEKTEGKSLHDMAAKTADKLKQALLHEREQTEKMKFEVLEHKEKLVELSDEIVNNRKTIEDQQVQLQKSDANVSETVASQSKSLAEQAKRLHESEMRVSAALREIEVYKSQNSQLEKRLSEFQEIVCCMKRQHKIEKEGMFTMDSSEFKNVLSKELNRQEKRHREEVKTLQITIATLQSQYAELEDEFREALHIEAERYAKANFQSVTSNSELEKLQTLHRRSKEKEEKCQSIISQLTAVAKEQKLKIAELLNGKKDVTQLYEDRISKLEVVAENGHRNSVQLELVKQEKSRLLSQLAALHTVVDGLRDERKLWGHELAQQGASLAQDRGRLESRIETLQQEISSLRKQNERDLDALKIKSKIAEDQTETIHKMKQALVDKDREVVRIQEESLDQQKKMEQDIEDLTQENAELNEQISALVERKKELKENVAASEQELDDLKQVHSKLVKKWSEKGRILSQLEKQVKQMKETYEKRTKDITKERDEAIETKRLLTERLAKADAAFREQLEVANAAHQNEMLRVMKNGENEVAMMKRKVLSVEEEMREVLRDADRQKKAMEAKLKKVTSVFSELQEGLRD